MNIYTFGEREIRNVRRYFIINSKQFSRILGSFIWTVGIAFMIAKAAGK